MGSTTRSPCWQLASSPTLNKSKWHLSGACSRKAGCCQHPGLGNPLPHLPPAPCPPSWPHPGVQALQAGAVSIAQHPRVGGEVTPAPGRMVPKKHGLGVVAEPLQPVGRQCWLRAELPFLLGHPYPPTPGDPGVCKPPPSPEHLALPCLDVPKVDSSTPGADSQLPREVRAVGWGTGITVGAGAPTAMGRAAEAAKSPPREVPFP